MKCPVCNKNIKVKTRDVTEGREGKIYDRAIYSCDDCDSWVTEEIPRGKSHSLGAVTEVVEETK